MLVQMAGIRSLIESGRVLIKAALPTIKSPSIEMMASIRILYLQLKSQPPMRWIISLMALMKFVGHQSLKSIPFHKLTLAANQFVVSVEVKVFHRL